MNRYRRDFVSNVKAELAYREKEDSNQSVLYPCWRIELDYNQTLPYNTKKHITYVEAKKGDVWYSADQSYYVSSCNRTASTTFCTYTGDGFGDWAANETVHYIHSTLLNREYDDSLFVGENTRTVVEQSAKAVSARHVVFYVGHGDIFDMGNKTHNFLKIEGGARVYDYQVFPNSTGNSNFVFFWSCLQAYTSESNGTGGYDDNGDAHGWAFVYKKQSMSDDGYHYPDGEGFAFLGFKGLVPFLGEVIEDVPCAGQKFVQYFYDAMKLGYSINLALDYATGNTWGVYNWGSGANPLHRYAQIGPPENRTYGMRLYGDGSWHLGPSITVKTNYGGVISVWVKINGEMVGYTDLTVEFEVEGTYEVYIQPTYFKSPYVYNFDHWESGSRDNPRTLYVDSVTTITAYYIRRTPW